MARKKKKINMGDGAKEVASDRHIQNDAPVLWDNFDQCWNACVKNGENRHKEACKIYLKSLDWLDKPSKWIEGMQLFGIPVEK